MKYLSLLFNVESKRRSIYSCINIIPPRFPRFTMVGLRHKFKHAKNASIIGIKSKGYRFMFVLFIRSPVLSLQDAIFSSFFFLLKRCSHVFSCADIHALLRRLRNNINAHRASKI